MPTPLNLNALRVFDVAARLGSFQHAADALHISQGAVSQRIKALEEVLGLRLFERAARGVTLTPSGAAYHAEIVEPLARIETATRHLLQQDRPITFRVGPSFATRWLMPRLARFRAAHPDLSVTTDVQEAVLNQPLGRHELAVLPRELMPQTPALETRELTRFELLAVCQPELPRPSGALELETILTLPLLQDAKERWARLIADQGLAATPGYLNFDRSALALDAARNGHGVAIAPRHLVETALETGELITLWRDPAPSEETLHLCWARAHAQERKLRRALDWVLAEFGQPPV